MGDVQVSTRWVIKQDDGLGVVTTDGHQPPHALCICEDDWTVHGLHYDKETKMVIHVPPGEVIPVKISDKKDVSFNIVRAVHWIEKYKWPAIVFAGMLFLVCFFIIVKYDEQLVKLLHLRAP